MKKNVFYFCVALFLCTLAVLIYINGIQTAEKNISAAMTAVEDKAMPAAQTKVLPAAVTNTPDKEISANVSPVLEQKSAPHLRIVAVGDILLGRGVGKRLQDGKKGYIYPFEKVADILKSGDVVFGNLEEPITSSTHSLTGIKQGGKWILKNEPEALEGIKYAGFNLLSLANNHIMDYYEKGLYDTIDLLDKNKIAYAGAGKNIDEARKPAIVEYKSLKIGMLSYTDMADIVYKGNPQLKFRAEKDKSGVSSIIYDFSVKPAKYNFEFMKEEIKRVRDSVDILIISFHWGTEESFEVFPKQVEFAHFLLDSGADMILGHHPHQFQGIEIYKGKPIVYSMGNFIFDQNDLENQESFILQMDYSDKKLTNLNAIPIRTINKTQVVPQAGEKAAAMLKRQVQLSEKLNTKSYIEGDKIIYNLD